MQHERFHYSTLEDVKLRAAQLGVSLPFAQNTHVLAQPVSFGPFTLKNRLGVAPMEGVDGTLDGAPTDMTLDRYLRYARGGAGLIWVEAVALTEESRSGLRQLTLTEKTVDAFKRMVEQVKQEGVKANGFAPFMVIQAHHSGRYSIAADGKPNPMIACHHAVCEKDAPLADSCIVTDDYLKKVEDDFALFARLAKQAGFDGVDVKACHGYLLGELTSAFTRPGLYGGSFENRMRLLFNAVDVSRAEVGQDMLITARVGIYDGLEWPLGFGVKEGEGLTPDLSEPIRLMKELKARHGMPLANLSVGNPYIYLNMNRPTDAWEGKLPNEQPLISMARIADLVGRVKKGAPEMGISLSSPTYLRRYADLYAAGAVEAGLCDHVLFARMALAYPDFANDIATRGRLDAGKVCLTCGGCDRLISNGRPTGCILRGNEVYRKHYKELG